MKPEDRVWAFASLDPNRYFATSLPHYFVITSSPSGSNAI
jgi:hypothetical protein